jgi:hypothetical protein
MKRKNTTTSESSHEPDRWLVREETHNLNTMKETRNIRVVFQLVWGHWVYPRGANGSPHIVGESHHELHGPTAHTSMVSFAEDLNMRKVPPSEIKKCVADGGSKVPNNDPNQMGFAMMIEPDFKRFKK